MASSSVKITLLLVLVAVEGGRLLHSDLEDWKDAIATAPMKVKDVGPSCPNPGGHVADPGEEEEEEGGQTHANVSDLARDVEDVPMIMEEDVEPSGPNPEGHTDPYDDEDEDNGRTPVSTKFTSP